MKKALIILLVTIVACTAVFAADEAPVTYEDIDFAYQPSMARYSAMGQSGLANAYRMDSFYTNPSLMYKTGFGMSLPSFSFTMFNLQKVVSDEETMEIFNRIVDGSSSDSDVVTLMTKLIGNLEAGKNMLAQADSSFAIKFGNFGLGSNVQMKYHSLMTGSNLEIIPEFNFAQTVAIGVPIIESDVFSLSAGVSGHYVYKAYLKGLGNSEITALMSDSDDIADKLLWETPAMGGYAIPVDVGVSASFFNDALTVSATANNLNGTYHMKSYTGAGYLVNDIAGENTIEDTTGHTPNDSVDFEIKTPWSLNFGAAYVLDLKVIKPTFTVDLIDMYEMVREFSAEDFRASDLLLHMNAGAEVELLKLVQLRAGVNRGYMSVGAGFGLPGLRVDASYGWQEFGAELGDKPVDSFTIKVNVGYDK